ncbi:putative O-glycosylation ligase, exosortase A system-associated [Aestuariibacter salexigens]|uniref:putative O-glycosylation ligase, exosortase A system-associated n=1 Tax=Aestuariibacter salexigens TaxID=226010 RepID=UPI00146FA631
MAGVLPFLIYFALRRPYLGLSLWLWSSLVPLQAWTFGFATSIRWNFIFAVCTIIAYFINDKPKQFKLDSISGSFLLFFICLTIASITHDGYGPHVWDRYDRFIKASLFFLFTLLIVNDKKHVMALCWAMVLSVVAISLPQGIYVILSGGGHVVTGIGSSFNDRNLAALAVLMCLPILYFLHLQYRAYKLINIGLIGAVVFCAAYILGSGSRGALLGVCVFFGFFLMRSKQKMPIIAIGVTVGILSLLFFETVWSDRADTFSNLSEDESFMGRVIAWKLHLLMALEDPFFGGGFDAASYGPTFQYLLLNWDAVNFIASPYPSKVYVAHSIYFQVLGDTGFLGFFTYFLMIGLAYKTLQKCSKIKNDEWLKEAGTYYGLSVICFLCSGAALSAAYNELITAIIAIASCLQHLSKVSKNSAEWRS